MENKARLFQSVGSKLGWDITPEKFLERVEQLNKGLINEDEFIYLLSWFGKCKLIHKYDQDLVLGNQKEKFKIPDLYVIFENENGEEKPYLVEIKTSKENKLSWSEKYYEGLVNYSKSVNIPLLIAWKWNTFSIWSLFNIEEFEKPNLNYKIDYQKAHMKNMLGKLCGDGIVVPNSNFDFNIVIDKKSEEIVNSESKNVRGLISDLYSTNRDGNMERIFDSSITALMFAISLDEDIIELEDKIILKYSMKNNSSIFIQNLVLNSIKFFSSSPEISWYRKMKDNSYPFEYKQLITDLIDHCENSKLIDYIFIPEPNPNI